MLPYNFIRHVPIVCFGFENNADADADAIIKSLELTEDEQKTTLEGKGYIYFLTKTPPAVISVHILAKSVCGILEGYRELTARMKQLMYGDMVMLNLITINSANELTKTCSKLVTRNELLRLRNETFLWYSLQDSRFAQTQTGDMLENLLQAGTSSTSLAMAEEEIVTIDNPNDEYQKVDIALRAATDIPKGSILGICNMPQIKLCTFYEWNRNVDPMSKCLKTCFHHICIQRSSEKNSSPDVEVFCFSMALNPFLSMLSNARDFRQAPSTSTSANVVPRHVLRFKHCQSNLVVVPSIHILYEALTDIAVGQEILVDNGGEHMEAQMKRNKSALELMDFAARSSLKCSLLLRQSSGGL